MTHVLDTLPVQDGRRCVGRQSNWSSRAPAERNLAGAAAVVGSANEPSPPGAMA